MTNPKLLILDEATEGLSPTVRSEIWKVIEFLKTKNISILIIDKSLKQLLDLADKFYIVEKGKTVWEGFSQNLTSLKNVFSFIPNLFSFFPVEI